jgi:hypothetical protein
MPLQILVRFLLFLLLSVYSMICSDLVYLLSIVCGISIDCTGQGIATALHCFTSRPFVLKAVDAIYPSNQASTAYFISLTLAADILCIALIVAVGAKQYKLFAGKILHNRWVDRRHAVTCAFHVLPASVPVQDTAVTVAADTTSDDAASSSSSAAGAVRTINRDAWLSMCAQLQGKYAPTGHAANFIFDMVTSGDPRVLHATAESDASSTTSSNTRPVVPIDELDEFLFFRCVAMVAARVAIQPRPTQFADGIAESGSVSAASSTAGTCGGGAARDKEDDKASTISSVFGGSASATSGAGSSGGADDGAADPKRFNSEEAGLYANSTRRSTFGTFGSPGTIALRSPELELLEINNIEELQEVARGAGNVMTVMSPEIASLLRIDEQQATGTVSVLHPNAPGDVSVPATIDTPDLEVDVVEVDVDLDGADHELGRVSTSRTGSMGVVKVLRISERKPRESRAQSESFSSTTMGGTAGGDPSYLGSLFALTGAGDNRNGAIGAQTSHEPRNAYEVWLFKVIAKLMFYAKNIQAVCIYLIAYNIPIGNQQLSYEKSIQSVNVFYWSHIFMLMMLVRQLSQIFYFVL